MERICLDFEAAVDFLRGDPAIIEKLKYYADKEEICITSFTMIHLLEAINKPDVVNNFTSNVTILPFDTRAVLVCAKILVDLRERGYTRSVSDSTLTAAICMANDAFLFSRSPSKFDGIKGLKKV